MNPSHRLGWLPDVPDVRDVPFRAMYIVPRKLPPRADLRAGCSPVENQGDLGSCTAQALAGALEFLELAALPDSRPRPRSGLRRAGRRAVPIQPVFHDLSRLFIYYNERAAMGTVLEDSGAMLRVGIKTMAKLGACKEALWPYVIARFASKPTARCYAEAAGHTVKSYQRLASLPEMKACLARGLPFVFGFSVYEHAMTPAVAKTGVIRLPRSGERMLGGHAILAVGYDDASGRLLFRNSWGASWGQKGYGEIPYDYLTSRELSNDFWCIQSTASDVYALRKICGL